MVHKQIRLQFSAVGILAILLALPGAVDASAAEQVGTLTQIEGDVKLFTHPSKKLQKEDGTHVLYEGEYYLVQPGKAGLKLDQGNIIRTAPGAKARVIYENGDQMYVGPASAMRVFWDKDGKTRMDLAYGKVRGVVEKGGPRSKLQIRTKSATMGVRGTDFFIADGGADGGTEVSIMRGAVEMKPKAPSAKPFEVKSGFSASLPPPPPADAPVQKVSPVVELRKTTQEELKGIQKSSVIAAKPKYPAAPQEAVAPEIAALEKKAVETTMKDIKTHDPKLFAQLQAKAAASGNLNSVNSIDELNGKAISVLVAEAPKAPEKRKPFKSEIDNLEEGAYEKYFKIQE